MDQKLVIGLSSGTSVDGIDAALVSIAEIDGTLKAELIAGQTFDYDSDLRAEILAVCAGEPRAIAQICELDDRIASAFAQAAIAIMPQHPQPPDFIASHGQTVFHRPPVMLKKGRRAAGEQGEISKTQLGYSVQLGRGVVIAELTHIPTVSNFRIADMEVGGQGAPLVPLVDWLLLTHATKIRACQNIGGISNVTYLPASGKQDQVFGFDNAPGNVLIDMTTKQLFDLPFDSNGDLARQGEPCLSLVELWLDQNFFVMPPPKSTGRELFSPAYLQKCLILCNRLKLSHHDILATITELTARAIAQSYRKFLPKMPDEVLLCGGGSRNQYLVNRLEQLLAPVVITNTDSAGVNADFKEAIAFAVLGYLRMSDRAGNLPKVTGARKSVLLGEIHIP